MPFTIQLFPFSFSPQRASFHEYKPKPTTCIYVMGYSRPKTLAGIFYFEKAGFPALCLSTPNERIFRYPVLYHVFVCQEVMTLNVLLPYMSLYCTYLSIQGILKCTQCFKLFTRATSFPLIHLTCYPSKITPQSSTVIACIYGAYWVRTNASLS